MTAVNPINQKRKDEDGYYQIEYEVNINTYYLYESVVSPVALSQSRAFSNAAPKSNKPLGEFDQYRLSQCVDNEDYKKEKGEIVKLAHVQKGELVVNPRAIEIFNKYPNNEIAFVGNYGRLNSGKSFWYDKILNLSQFEGNNYSSNDGGPGLYFWSVPFTKDNLKIFLLDYVGFTGKDTLTPDQQKLLDFQILLCEKLVIIPEPNDQNLTVLKPAYNHLLQSQQRFSQRGIPANKFSPYWPNQVYTLYRSAKPVKKQIDNIGLLFSVYNFSIMHDALNPSKSIAKEDLLKSNLVDPHSTDALNAKYVKMTSIVFQDIYQKMKGKQYGNVAVNGKSLPLILQQSKTKISKGGQIKIDHIFEGVKGNIYDKTIERCKAKYLKQVQNIRNNVNPKPVDVLTEGFQKGSNAAFAEFDKQIIDSKIHSQYEDKLRNQIDKIQKQLLEENKQKTIEYYNKLLPNYDSQTTVPIYVSELNKSFSNDKQKKKLDHNDSAPIAERLKSSIREEGDQIVLVSNTDAQKADKLKKIIQMKKKQLQNVKIQKTSGLKGGNDPKIKQLTNNHDQLNQKAEQLKKLVIEHKQAHKIKTPAEKEQLLTVLRSTHAKNEEALSKIVNAPHKENEINDLKKKLEKQIQKNEQFKDGVEVFDKSFASQRSKSVIRDVQTSNIKKVTLK